LKNTRILLVGVGGLGCPASLVLAEAGVATLGLMDPDKVELSNLHRQILYSEKDLNRSKVEAAAEYLKKRHPQTQFHPIAEAFGPSNAEKILNQFDLVIDGLDRLEKKFLLNDWCVRLGKPFVHAGVVKFEGQVLPVLPGVTACLRCLIPRIPPPFAMPTCQEAGVLGSFSQVIGYLQAHEALRLAQGKGPFRLWKVDIQRREVRSIIPERNIHCEACSKGRVEDQNSAMACQV
jgi:molybdopterin/thiamine biosynthesis adenylyltransferase